MEYRGYDSAGIALLTHSEIALYKAVGRVFELDSTLPDELCSHIGIGHTRWATHGEVCAQNAHPHLSFDKSIAVVHNGVIENADELKAELTRKGISLVSSTDSEIIAHMLALCDERDMLKKIEQVGKRLEGSATFLAIDRSQNAIYLQRKGASMSIGIGKGELFAASDTLAISKYTSDIIVLEDGEIARLSADGVQIYKNGSPIIKSITKIKRLPPKECSCHMRAEMDETPLALVRTLKSVRADTDVELKNILLSAKRIYLCGCGTAYHACLYGKHVLEGLANIPCECVVASEIDEQRFVDSSCAGIFISQSGETRDTLLALERFRRSGAKTLAITNVEASAITMLADKTILLDAGAEIAVAATKSYVCQLLALYLIAHKIAGTRPESTSRLCSSIRAIDECLYNEKLKGARVFFIGKGIDYVTAREGALKLKEITYKSADAYQAGELKHGTIALIDSSSVVIAIVTQAASKRRMQAAISELRSRGAHVIALSSVGDVGADRTLYLPPLDDELCYPMLSVIPLQELALSCSLALGLSPDKPRNLAKSVTVI